MSWRPPLEATRLRYRLENDLENVDVDFVRDDSLGDHLDLAFANVPDDKFRYTAPMSALSTSEDVKAVVDKVLAANIGARRAPEPRW